MRKRLLSAILAAAMVVSMAACGNEPVNNESVATESISTEATASEATETQQMEKIEKFDPAITITTVRQNTNSNNQDYKEGESVENNVWTQLFLEKYGIDLKYDWLAANSSDYSTKINLLLADGGMPDYLQISGQETLQNIIDADLVQPLDEVWEMYASDLTKQVMGEAADVVWDACTFDGKLMAIPFCSAPKESALLLYIRQDWLDNLGMKAPETMQDVIDLCEAFATQDPDKDGKQDTYAIAMDKTVTARTLPLFNVNEFYAGSWYYNAEGELTNGFTEDGYKETLQLLRGWIEKGYIHPEWFTMDANKAKELVANGQVGVYFGSYSDPISTFAAQHANEPDSDWLVMTIPDWEGDPLTQFCGLGISYYYVVSKECEHPEAIVMMLNEFVEKFYYSTEDSEYYKYVNTEAGAAVWQNTHVRTYRGLKNIDVAQHMEDYYSGKLKLEDLTCEERATVAQIDAYKAGDETMWQWNKIFGEDGAAGCLAAYVENDAYVYNITWSTPTMTEATNSTIMSDYATEVRINLLQGNMSFDKWNEYVKNYRSMGYDIIVEEIKEKYNLK